MDERQSFEETERDVKAGIGQLDAIEGAILQYPKNTPLALRIQPWLTRIQQRRLTSMPARVVIGVV